MRTIVTSPMLASIATFVGLACLGCVARMQAQVSCGADGRRVVARRWDAVLGRSWETVEDCAHAGRPDRIVAGVSSRPVGRFGEGLKLVVVPPVVRAGDEVSVWRQEARVWISMAGVAEQAGRAGDRVVVRMTRQSAELGVQVQRISGTIRGVGNVEMDRQ